LGAANSAKRFKMWWYFCHVSFLPNVLISARNLAMVSVSGSCEDFQARLFGLELQALLALGLEGIGGFVTRHFAQPLTRLTPLDEKAIARRPPEAAALVASERAVAPAARRLHLLENADVDHRPPPLVDGHYFAEAKSISY
jgi:hypothetical protein